MKQTITPTFLALALTIASCGGGTNVQNNNDTTAAAQTTATPESSATIAGQVAKLLDSNHNFTTNANGGQCKYDGGSEYEHHEISFHLYPLNSGGYKVYVCDMTTYTEAPRDSHEFKFYAKTFNDGRLSDSQAETAITEFASKDSGDGSYDVFTFGDSDITVDIWVGEGPNATNKKCTFHWDGEKLVKEQGAELFAYEIIKQLFTDPKDFERIADELENGIGEECGVPREEWGIMEHLKFTAHPDDMYPEEGYLDCFPIKTGGYFVMYSTMSCGDYEHWAYFPYIYKDGVLDKADRMLPTPGIKDYYSNSDQFPKDAAKVLSMAMNNPEYSFNNEDGSITLTVRFTAMELDERGGVLPKPLKGFQRKEGYYFPTIEYHWDGEKFARNADSKPYKEDLQYFDEVPAEWKTTTAYQVTQKLNLEGFDNQRSDNNYVYYLWKDEFDAPQYYVMCFPYKDGGCLVLTGYNCSSLREYKTYTYKDGSLSESDFKLPLCPLSELLDSQKTGGREQAIAALEEVFKKTPQYVVSYNITLTPDIQEFLISYSLSWDAGLSDEVRNQLSGIGKWQDCPKYKWDGENFVKQ
jgi:hypothetical protein